MACANAARCAPRGGPNAEPRRQVDLHISNVHAREAVYQKSLMSPVVTAVMAGFGVHGYALAVDGMAHRLQPG